MVAEANLLVKNVFEPHGFKLTDHTSLKNVIQEYFVVECDHYYLVGIFYWMNIID